MSFRVLIIPEDFRKDEHLLQPILQRLIDAQEKSQPRVRVCNEPKLGGTGEALKIERIREILDRYRSMIDCFLLVVDRDGHPGRRQRLEEIESWARGYLGRGKAFFGITALQEVEIWALAGMRDLPTEWRWREMREEPHCKEVYFDAYVRQRGFNVLPFGGRRLLGEEAARNFSRVRELCDEDLGDLERRFVVWLQETKAGQGSAPATPPLSF